MRKEKLMRWLDLARRKTLAAHWHKLECGWRSRHRAWRIFQRNTQAIWTNPSRALCRRHDHVARMSHANAWSATSAADPMLLQGLRRKNWDDQQGVEGRRMPRSSSTQCVSLPRHPLRRRRCLIVISVRNGQRCARNPLPAQLVRAMLCIIPVVWTRGASVGFDAWRGSASMVAQNRLKSAGEQLL